MITRSKYKKLLISGLKQYEDDFCLSLPAKEEINHSFSENYLKEKDSLLQKFDRPFSHVVSNTQKYATAIAVCLVFVVLSLVTANSLKDNKLNFNYRVYNTFAETLPEENPERTSIEKAYTTISVPASFSNIEKTLTTVFFDTTWKNAEGYYISLTQYTTDTPISFNSEEATLKETSINRTPCLVCKNNSDYLCIWKFDGYMFMLSYPSFLGEEFMGKVVGKLTEENRQ